MDCVLIAFAIKEHIINVPQTLNDLTQNFQNKHLWVLIILVSKCNACADITKSMTQDDNVKVRKHLPSA